MAGLVRSEEVELNPGHPERYIVAKGDTLWDIAGKFLARPWQWPQIWHDNPHIANPHWIYPGDELVLTLVDGRPRLQIGRRYEESRPAEQRLSPTIRIEPLAKAIPTIPMSAIQQFLTQPKVASAGVMESAPYVVALADEHVVGGAGDRVYVRGLSGGRLIGYMIFRPGKPYLDAGSGEVLGYEALYVADATLDAGGEISTMSITQSEREVVIGDRILPVERQTIPMHYVPHAPYRPIRGHIIAVVDGVSQIGQYQVVIIDRGAADGIESGHVLEIYQSGQSQRDFISPFAGDEVILPEEKEGLLMVFRPYDRVSFALVLKATRAIHLNDAVQNP